MSSPRKIPAPDNQQPKSFRFSEENEKEISRILSRYPADRPESAVMPLLDLAQRQNKGWVSRSAMDHVAEILGMPFIRVYEVATFYSMYNLAPTGKHHVQVCTTTPCWLRGSGEIVSRCRRLLDIEMGETSKDGIFTLDEVECLGACVNAPMVQIGDDYYEDLDGDSIETILTLLRLGKEAAPGPQVERLNAAPEGGLTTLLGKSGKSSGKTGKKTE